MYFLPLRANRFQQLPTSSPFCSIQLLTAGRRARSRPTSPKTFTSMRRWSQTQSTRGLFATPTRLVPCRTGLTTRRLRPHRHRGRPRGFSHRRRACPSSHERCSLSLPARWWSARQSAVLASGKPLMTFQFSIRSPTRTRQVRRRC